MRWSTILCLLLLCAPSVKANEDQARAWFVQGEVAFDAGRFNEAAADFDKAFTLSQRPKLLWNMAQAHRKQYEVDRDPANLRRACLLYGHYADLAEEEGGRREALETKRQCDEAIARIDAAAAPTEKPKPATVPSATEARRFRWPGLAIAGGGLVLLGVGLTFGLLASDAASKVEAGAHLQPPAKFGVYAGDEANGQAYQVASYVLYGAGALLVVAGAAYAFLRLPSRGATQAFFAPSPTGIAVVGRW